MAKKTEQLMVRLTEEVMDELERIQETKGIKPADVARMGLVEVMQRLQAGAPAVNPELAQMVAKAEEHGLDLVAIIGDAIAGAAQPQEAKAS